MITLTEAIKIIKNNYSFKTTITQPDENVNGDKVEHISEIVEIFMNDIGLWPYCYVDKNNNFVLEISSYAKLGWPNDYPEIKMIVAKDLLFVLSERYDSCVSISKCDRNFHLQFVFDKEQKNLAFRTIGRIMSYGYIPEELTHPISKDEILKKVKAENCKIIYDFSTYDENDFPYNQNPIVVAFVDEEGISYQLRKR